jgi:hypothetical protein
MSDVCDRILSETTRRIEEVAQRHGQHFSTVYRWLFRGLPGPDGKRVRLEACRLGRKWLTSDEAVARFSAALTPNLTAEAPNGPRSASKRQRSSERAGKQLESLGI